MQRFELRLINGVVGNGQPDLVRNRFAPARSPWTARLDEERPMHGRPSMFPAVMQTSVTTQPASLTNPLASHSPTEWRQPVGPTLSTTALGTTASRKTALLAG